MVRGREGGNFGSSVNFDCQFQLRLTVLDIAKDCKECCKFFCFVCLIFFFRSPTDLDFPLAIFCIFETRQRPYNLGTRYSEDLNQDWSERQKTDTTLLLRTKERAALPIFNMKSTILEHIHEHPVILIRGNTGCGKTTQVCQYILDDFISSGQGAYCNIVCTQPR